MKYKNSQAQSTKTAGTVISFIGMLSTGISLLMIFASISEGSLLGISAVLTVTAPIFMGGMLLIGFGSGLKCLSNLLESNYRIYKNSIVK